LVNIKNAKLLGTVSADAGGTASFASMVPQRFSGRTFRLQAVEFETCRFTNLVVYTFP
jgi:protocatechuate 3,4-dioxygenase beta subunit